MALVALVAAVYLISAAPALVAVGAACGYKGWPVARAVLGGAAGSAVGVVLGTVSGIAVALGVTHAGVGVGPAPVVILLAPLMTLVGTAAGAGLAIRFRLRAIGPERPASSEQR